MMNNDKLIRLSSAVDLCMKKAKFYQPEMFGSDQECFTAKVVATELAGEIRNLPPVGAEPVRHGRWEWKNGKPFCSACKKQNEPKHHFEDGSVEEYDYCPNCGTKMDGGKQDAD